jgi:DNA-binding beta-propeller fold protein YncE
MPVRALRFAASAAGLGLVGLLTVNGASAHGPVGTFFYVPPRLVVVANDNKVANVNGVVQVLKSPPPDTVAVLDFSVSPPKLVGEVAAPGSMVGPPLSVAITPDEQLALATSSMKVDPKDPTKQTADNRMSVIDLTTTPPKVLATLETGLSPAGLSIDRNGALALVANRNEGTVSVFTIVGKTVRAAGKVDLGDAKSGPSHVAIAPDGKTALVTRDGDDRISVLSIQGSKVEYTKRDMFAGVHPYGIDIASTGAVAAVANIGRASGDTDTVSLIDLEAKPPRVVDTVAIAQTTEGIKMSPDGTLVAVVAGNGSNKAKDSPYYNDGGKLVLLRVAPGPTLAKVAEAPVGHWPQGVAFSSDGGRILVGNMVEKELWMFSWNGTTLRDTGQRIKMNGGPCALRVAER